MAVQSAEKAEDSYSYLKDAIDVMAVGDKLYSSVQLSNPLGYRAVYGGTVMGQALMAATKSVRALHSDFLLHSFHCYFVAPTQVYPPIVYKVGHAKDGRNFCSLTVKAKQGDKVNFHCMASFSKSESSVVTYLGCPMPNVPKPGVEDSTSKFKLVNILGQFPGLRSPNSLIEILACVDETMWKNVAAREASKPWNAIWIRGRNTFSSKDPQNYHRIAMVYASDFLLARLILNKYPRLEVDLITSLDHSVWFHDLIEADQWYLYVAEVQRAADGRSLTGCRIYSQDGTIVATCSQESLIRPKL